MKRIQALAWLLVIALLAALVPALGEELGFEGTDDSAQKALVGLETGPSNEDFTIDLSGDEPSENPSGEEPDAVNASSGPSIRYYRPTQELPDNDALFAGYVDMLFGRPDALGLQKNGYIGDTLTGFAKDMFDYLSVEFEKVAAGKRSSTIFELPSDIVPADFSFDNEEYWNDILRTFDTLLFDCPYHQFWFDKTRGAKFEYNGTLVWKLYVAKEYAKGDFETDATKIQSAQIAVTNAKKVVRKYAQKSNYGKLIGYKEYICDATDYNDEAMADPATPYGNPWQVIWVFDGDPSTKVVCEGYSKSLQYLCDLSTFDGDVRCYTVEGYAGDSNPDTWEGHMWNIVTMEDGVNYHADLTFCDTGTENDFLVGTSGVAADGSFNVREIDYYQYDEDTLNAFPAKVLKLSKKDYDPNKPAPRDIAIAQGKSATLYMGNKLTLEAKLKPKGAEAKLTWTSSKPGVATVSKKGVVTPKKAGETVVTVKTDNDLSAKITVKVVDAKGVKIKEGKSAGLKVGKKLTLHAVVSPSKVKTKLTWTSSNPKVATVTSKGVVKALRAGTAKITVTTANKQKATIKITVK